MSKELEALERLMNVCCDTCKSEICGPKTNESCPRFINYKIIYTALKRLEELEKGTTMKKKKIDLSIEELKNICKKSLLCRDCSLFSKKIGTCIGSYLRIRQLIDEDELNEEVEVLK